MSTLRLREGDQPLPTVGQENVGEAVLADLDSTGYPLSVREAMRADLTARIALGIERYGQPLQTFNGRDAWKDAHDESLDLLHYLKQARLEATARQDWETDRLARFLYLRTLDLVCELTQFRLAQATAVEVAA